MWRCFWPIMILLAAGLAHAEQASVGDAEAARRRMDGRLDTLFGEHAPYRDFFEAFKRAVLAGDRAAVARMVDYPVRASIRGRVWTLRSSRELLAQYERIFIPRRVAIVAAQDYAALFARDQGVMIGEHGEIWFAGTCEDRDCKRQRIGIIAFNPVLP